MLDFYINTLMDKYDMINIEDISTSNANLFWSEISTGLQILGIAPDYHLAEQLENIKFENSKKLLQLWVRGWKIKVFRLFIFQF